MDEKNKPALKVNAMGGTKVIPRGRLGSCRRPSAHGGHRGGRRCGRCGCWRGRCGDGPSCRANASLALDGEGVSDAAAAMAKATVEAKTLAEERDLSNQPLFQAVLVDLKYRDWESPVYDDAIAGGLCRQLPRVRLQPDEALLPRPASTPAGGRHGRLKLLILEGISGYR